MRPAIGMTDFICTTYNAEKTLPATLDSIRAQSDTKWRLLIWDDGSADTTLSILAQAADIDPRIVLLGEEKLGRAAALNRCLAAVESDWFLNIDADDLAHPDRLSISLRAASKAPDTTLFCTRSLQIFGGELPDWNTHRYPVSASPHLERIGQKLLLRNPIDHSSIMGHTDRIREAGGYSKDRTMQIDYELWLRLWSRGLQISKIDEPLSAKRVHAEQKFESHLGTDYIQSSLDLQWQYIQASGQTARYALPFLARRSWLSLPGKLRRAIRRGATPLRAER